MNTLVGVLLGGGSAALAVMVLLVLRQRREHSRLSQEYEKARTEARELRERYSRIIDLEGELTAAKDKLDQTKRDRQRFDSENEERRAKLNQEYEQALATYNALKKEISLLEENLEDISFGLYKPHFSFQTSAEYKAALEDLRNKEREFVRAGRAAICPQTWVVGDSQKEGARMVKLYEKVLLRAFNGECDAALANVSWNNVTRMEERVEKSFDAVNKLGDVVKVSITREFLKLKLDEIRLAYEYEDKRRQEREEQRRIREQIREEEKAQQEIEKAREEAEAEEARFQRALEKAREEAAKATGAQLQKLTEQISSFESKLDEARQKKEKAKSRAESGLKSGFVYVISNIGSFGEGIYKIGMTRRLDPEERILELGGASVPFPFDVHATLWSDNAPELENALHQLFEERRLNLVNARREFYRNVQIAEVEEFVKRKGLSAQFIEQPEAREYRETLARREQRVARPKGPDKFARNLFGASSNTQ
ncbi:MAG: DUF4041 domain-containing protein [Terriglobia bacterium]